MAAELNLTTGQALVRLLENYGVNTVFGIPGVHTLELYRGLPGSKVQHVLTRHEQGAGFMADGYARVTGKPGVCFVISGPGVTNITTPMGQAYADSIPMLVISSVNNSDSLGKGWGSLHETQDQRAITAPLTAFSALALHSDDVPGLIAGAFTVFNSERPRPVHISIPLDVMSAQISRDWTTEVCQLAERGLAAQANLTAAAQCLQAANKPMIIAGGGALDAAQEIRQLAEKLAAPVFTTVAGKGILPPEHALCAGSSLCVQPGWDLINQADVVLAVGTEMADTDFWRDRLPISGQLLRVDIDSRKLNDFYPCAVPLLGDAKKTVAALNLSVAGSQAQPQWAPQAVQQLQQQIRAQHAPLQHVHQRVLDVIAQVMPVNTVVSADMTQLGYTGNYALPSQAVRSWLHPTGYGTLGYALPAAIGAKLGAPERPGLVLVGDGGILYSIQELATAAEELNSPLVVLLWNNQALGQIRDDMLDLDIEPIGVLPQTPDFKLLAKGFGCRLFIPNSLETLAADLAAAFQVPGVSLLELNYLDVRDSN